MSPTKKFLTWGPIILLGLFSVIIAYAFLGPAETGSAIAIIKNKKFVPASTYTQYNGTRQTGSVPIRESYQLELSAEKTGTMYASISIIGANEFEIGKKVNVNYTIRSIPFLWKKILVNEVKVVEE